VDVAGGDEMNLSHEQACAIFWFALGGASVSIFFLFLELLIYWIRGGRE